MTTTPPKLPTAGDTCYIHSYHKRDLNGTLCTVLEYAIRGPGRLGGVGAHTGGGRTHPKHGPDFDVAMQCAVSDHRQRHDSGSAYSRATIVPK